MALEESTKDTERLDFLTEEQVDTIYLDDGRIIDIGGSGLPWDVRVAIDALMTPSVQDNRPEAVLSPKGPC
jgi:hypothetical protein